MYPSIHYHPLTLLIGDEQSGVTAAIFHRFRNNAVLEKLGFCDRHTVKT